MRAVAYWLSLILIFVIPWENVIQLEGVGTVSRAVGLLVAAFWVSTVVVTGRFRKPRPFHLVVCLFVLWNVVSAFWSFDVEATVGRLQTYLQLLALVLILWDLYTTPAALKAGLQAYVLGACVATGSTVYNYFAASEFYYRRYSATGFNPDDLGPILALGIPLAWHLAVSASNGKKDYVLRLVNYAYIPVALFAILLSATRGAMIATLPAFVFILMTFTRFRLPSRVLIFTALVGALFTVQDLVPQSSFQRLATTGESLATGDLHGRVDIWHQGIAVFSEHPLLGVGSGAFRTAVGVGKVAHNTFISILVEVGAIGLILFAVILVTTLYQAMHQPKQTARFWLTVLLVWTLTASFMSWERRKQTWLFLSLVIVSAGLPVRGDEPKLRAKLPVKSIGLLKGETGEADSATPSARGAGHGNADGHNRLPSGSETGRGSQ